MQGSYSKAAQFGATCRAGRLVEAWLGWLNDPSDVARFQSVMGAAFSRAGAGAIVCADWRAVGVLPSEAGDALIELLRTGNQRLDRSAVLLPDTNAVLSLQVERLFRAAGNPGRRAFRRVDALLEWLAEVLRPDELQSAREFLKAVPRVSAP